MLLLSRPGAAALGALDAMLCWAATVAPAVFPFMVLLPALTGDAASGIYERLFGRVTERLYALPGGAAAALAVGMIGGSPAGALAARRMRGLNRGQMRRLALSAGGMSPAFLIGGVGAGMLGSASAGHVLLRAQLAVQLLLPLLLRFAWRRDAAPVPGVALREAEQPVRAAVGATLTICGWMAFFGAVGQAFQGWAGSGLAVPLRCLADVTAGCQAVAAMRCGYSMKMLLLAGLCGFGGVCIAMQNLAILREAGVRAWEYLAVRLLAGALTASFVALQLAGEFKAVSFAPRPFHMAALCAAFLAVPPILYVARGKS